MYWLYEKGHLARGEEIELTKAQYDRLQDGFGDYLVRVCTKEEIELIKNPKKSGKK